MDTEVITEFINGHVPEVLMVVAGIFALLLVHMYRKDKDSDWYKLAMLVGVVLGICIILISVTRYSSWTTFDAALILLAGFTLLIRPLTKIDIAILISLLVMGLIYIWLGGLTGDLATLASGWPRIIAAVVGGALVYMVLHFVQAAVQTVGKILNCWPILALLGIVCIAEGALLLAGEPSLFTLIEDRL